MCRERRPATRVSCELGLDTNQNAKTRTRSRKRKLIGIWGQGRASISIRPDSKWFAKSYCNKLTAHWCLEIGENPASVGTVRCANLFSLRAISKSKINREIENTFLCVSLSWFGCCYEWPGFRVNFRWDTRVPDISSSPLRAILSTLKLQLKKSFDDAVRLIFVISLRHALFEIKASSFLRLDSVRFSDCGTQSWPSEAAGVVILSWVNSFCMWI